MIKFQFHHSLIAFLLFFFVILYSKVSGQTGDYLLTHHDLNVSGIDNLNFEIKINKEGLLCIANRSGVLLYDGDDWEYISTPSAAVSLDFDRKGNIYVGCVGDYGKIDYKNYKYQFVSLKDTANQGGLYIRTLHYADTVYFLSEYSLEIHSTDGNYHKSIKIEGEDEYFTNVFHISDSLIVQSSFAFHLLKDDSLNLMPLELPDFSDILFFKKHPVGEKYLVGTSSNAVYIYEGGSFNSLKINAYLKKNSFHIIDAVWLSGSQYALSTLENGCLIIDFEKDEVHEQINYKKGLSDNEIYAISSDNEEGLWISHEFGLSRMESNIPVRSFSNYQGMDANLMAVYDHDTTLFVANSRGVLYLAKEHEYKSTVYYTLKKQKKSATKTRKASDKKKVESSIPSRKDVASLNKEKKKKTSLKGLFKRKKNRKKKNKPSNIKESEGNKEHGLPNPILKKDTVSKKKKKGLFSRVIGKLTGKKDLPEELEIEIVKIKGSAASTRQYVRHVRKDIVGTNFIYKSVEGIDTKMEYFIEFKNKLLVAGNLGVYEITKNGAELVVDASVRGIITEGGKQRIFISTHDNEILIYELYDDIWVESDYLEFYGDIILNMFSEENGNTWLTTSDKLYFYDSLYSANDDFEAYDIENQFIDDVRMIRMNNQLYLINSLGYFYLDEKTKKVVRDDFLFKKIGNPVKHLSEPNGTIWIFNGKNWFSISKEKEVKKVGHLGLFKNMSFITSSGRKFWLIDDNNDLYQYDPSETDSLVSSNRMFFRRIQNKKGRIDYRDDLVFNHDENSIQFELSRPDYLGLLKVEYQYKLKGLNDRWSNWSNNNKIDFNYLPPNKYTLSVRSRDAFGDIQESSQVVFTIKPPYWQTLWFYGVQIVLMSLLVFFSARLNRTSSKKYVIITEALTILTIIFIIEFLQTVAGNYLGIKSTPVIDFLIDVGIALFVFPLEQFLKKVMKAEDLTGNQGKGLLDYIIPKKSTA